MADFITAFNATMGNEGFPGYNQDNNGADVCAGDRLNYEPVPGCCGP